MRNLNGECILMLSLTHRVNGPLEKCAGRFSIIRTAHNINIYSFPFFSTYFRLMFVNGKKIVVLSTLMMEFSLNGSEVAAEFSEFKESDKTLKHELDSL